jgi:hypothetical protein
MERKLRTLYYNKYSLVYTVALKKSTAKKFPLNKEKEKNIVIGQHLLICKGIKNLFLRV